MTHFRRLAKEGTWIIVGQIIAVLGTLMLVRVLTEQLDPLQYGQFALGLTVAGLINQVVMGGIINGISRYYSIASEKKDLHRYLLASLKLMIYATLSVLIVGMILIIGLWSLGYSKWVGFAVIMLLYSVITGYNSVLSSIQNAARQRLIVAIFGGLDAWLKILLVICVLFWNGNSTTSVVIGYTLSTLIMIGFQFIFLNRITSNKIASNGESTSWLKEIWAFSWPFSTWGIFTWAQQSSDRWSLETFSSTRDVGMYSVLYQLGFSPISLVNGLIVSFLAPIIFQRSGDASDSSRNDSVHTIVLCTTTISFILTIIGFVASFGLHEPIFRLLVASKYQSVSYLLPWTVLAGGLFATGQLLTLKILSEIKPFSLINVKIVTALLGVGMNIYFTSIAGLIGVIAGLLAFSIVYFLWSVWIVLHNSEVYVKSY